MIIKKAIFFLAWIEAYIVQHYMNIIIIIMSITYT